MELPELTITVLDMKRTSLQSNTGRTAEGAVEYDSLREDTINVLQDLLARKRMDNRRAFEVLGRQLYEVLLNGRARALFERMFAESESIRNQGNENHRLRVQLSFMDEAAGLAGLPWEYLFHSNPGCFFSTSVDLVLSRFMRLDQERDASLNPGEDRLRILVVVSEPRNLSGVLAEPVIEAIEKLRERHPIDIAIQRVPTPDHLIASLKETRPHVLHFIGHGKFENRIGSIALLQPDEANVLWCDDRTFGEHLTKAGPVPRLVLLHLCEGGKVDLSANFAGLAPQLVRRNVQAVVAMQHPISNLDAIAFSRAFYAQIAVGTDVDHAVQLGRASMTTSDSYSSRGFGTPVLYMRSRTGIIMASGSSESSGNRRSGAAALGGGVRLGTPGGTGSRAAIHEGSDQESDVGVTSPEGDGTASFGGSGAASFGGGRGTPRSSSTFEGIPSGTSTAVASTAGGIRAMASGVRATPLRRLQTAFLDARQRIRGLAVHEDRKIAMLERLSQAETTLLQTHEAPEEWPFLILDLSAGEGDQEIRALLDGIATALQGKS